MDWQDKFVEAVQKRFPNNFWTAEERLLACYRQLADVSGAMQKAKGNLGQDEHGYEDLKHRIAASFIDLFVLAKQCDVDLEKEWQKALDWFNK